MIYKPTWCFRLLLVCFMGLFLSVIAVGTARGDVVNSCQNLGKVKDIDDLLFQFYSNIDNQCLFEVPTEELEYVWGIRVLDYVSISSEKKDTLRDVFNKEVQRLRKNEKGFFVTKKNFEQGISAFYIELTKKYVDENNGWGGAVGGGRFPKQLPLPQIINEPFDTLDFLSQPHIDGPEPIIPKDTVYQKYSKYYWINRFNSDEQPILFFKTDLFPIPSGFVFYSQARVLKFK